MKTVRLAVLALLLPLAAHAQDWRYTLTPYLYLPNVNGTLKYSIPPGAVGSPDVGVGPHDYLQNLSLALMLSGEARKGDYAIISDLVYLDFNKEGGSVHDVNFGSSAVSTSANVDTQSSLKGLEWTLAGARTVAKSDRGTLEVVTGFRYFDVKASSDWQLSATVSAPGGGATFPASGGVSQRSQLWDWIIGVRGRIRLGDGPWFAPYYLDVGWGSSSPTWQALLGVGYAFKWGDLLLAYRELVYDQGDDKLFQDFRFGGPTLGASFHF